MTPQASSPGTVPSPLLAWTTLCLGGYLAATIVVTSALTGYAFSSHSES